MNQKKMRITFRVPGEVNNGDIVQCPLCRKKFVVIPGLIRYGLDYRSSDDRSDVVCACCAKSTPISYYKTVSTGEPVELPLRRKKKDKEGGVHGDEGPGSYLP